MIEIAPEETEIEANWDDARLYCFSLNIDGKTGWRLPTKNELNEIYKSPNDLEKKAYWSSTEETSSHAWLQGFHSGRQLDFNKGFVYIYVRAIRTTV